MRKKKLRGRTRSSNNIFFWARAYRIRGFLDTGVFYFSRTLTARYFIIIIIITLFASSVSYLYDALLCPSGRIIK